MFFILIAAANPCPCGNSGSARKKCTCMPGQVVRYKKKVSGAILDRIDIHLYCPELTPDELSQLKPGESSMDIQKRVEQARKVQRKLFQKTTLQSNAEMTSRDIKEFCPLSDACLDLLRTAVSTYTLSARSYHKMIKLAQTIADLGKSNHITIDHLSEAFRYRVREE